MGGILGRTQGLNPLGGLLLVSLVRTFCTLLMAGAKSVRMRELSLSSNQLSVWVPSSLSGRLDMENSDLDDLRHCPCGSGLHGLSPE